MSKAAVAAKKNVVGLDIGYSNVKIAYGSNPDQEPTVIVRHAQAAPEAQVSGGDVVRDGEFRVELDGKTWAVFVDPVFVGKNAVRELHGDYPASAPYRALFLASLLAVSPDGKAIDHLITGLPVSQFLDPSKVEALIERLTGVHQVSPTMTIEVKKVSVVAQPVGTMLDINGFHEDADMFLESNVLVLDPGFFSVDWVLFQNGVLNRQSSNTTLKAMSQMCEAIDTMICDDYSGKGPGIERVETALKVKKPDFIINGQRAMYAPYIARAKEKVAKEAMSILRTQMRFLDSETVDFILLGGGGGSFYEEAIREVYPDARVITAEDSVTSNARGFWFHGVDQQ